MRVGLHGAAESGVARWASDFFGKEKSAELSLAGQQISGGLVIFSIAELQENSTGEIYCGQQLSDGIITQAACSAHSLHRR